MPTSRAPTVAAGIASALGALTLYQALGPLPARDLMRGLATAVFALAAADRIGRLPAARLRLHPAEALLAGFAGLFLAACALDVAGFLSRGPAGTLLLVLSLSDRPRNFLGATREVARSGVAWLTNEARSGPAGLAAAGLTACAVVWAFLSVLPPPVAMDAMAYHLALPMRALARGTFANPFPQNYDLYLLGKERLDVFSLALDPAGRGAAILNLAALPIGAAALLRLGGGVRWAPLLLLASPLPILLLAHTKPDCLAFAAAFWALVALEEGRPVRAGAWSAVALVAKTTTAFLVAPLAVAAAWDALRARRVREAVLAAGLPFLAVLPFLLPPHPSAAVPDFRPPAVLPALLVFFSLHVPASLSAPLTPLAAPLAIAGFAAPPPPAPPRRRERLLSGVLLCAVLLWLLSGSWPRFAAPVFLAAAALGLRTVAFDTPLGRAVASLVLLLSLAAGIRVVELRMDVLGYLAGRIDAAHYRAPWQSTAPLLLASGEALPGDAGRAGGPGIVLHGDHRVFPLGRDARVDDYFRQARLWAIAANAPDTASAFAALDADLAGARYLIDCSSVRLADVASGIAPKPPPGAAARLRAYLAKKRRLLVDDDGNAVYDLASPRSMERDAPPRRVAIPRVEVRPGRDSVVEQW